MRKMIAVGVLGSSESVDVVGPRAVNSVHCVTFRSPLRCLIGHVCISTLGGSQGPIEVRHTAGTDEFDVDTDWRGRVEAPRTSKKVSIAVGVDPQRVRRR